MSYYNFLLTLFIVIALLIMLVFYGVYRSSMRKGTDTEGMASPTKKRFIFFLSLTVVVIVLLSVTIPKSPYYRYADAVPSKVIYATASQFSFNLSSQPPGQKRSGPKEKIELAANELVEFRVGSADVNHGFAIYNDKAELIAQTQAMPGYINKLRWKFNQPGTYNILCIEYCGMFHEIMRTSFNVK
ncbi:MAG: hypothetical protein M9933_00670 [Chitinophagaceae bacterium]|nr:hypothetical protein [Chitinophagaceae bacterium]